jgi:hypothetical protein
MTQTKWCSVYKFLFIKIFSFTLCFLLILSCLLTIVIYIIYEITKIIIDKLQTQCSQLLQNNNNNNNNNNKAS